MSDADAGALCCPCEYRGQRCGLPRGHLYAHHTREGDVGDVSWTNDPPADELARLRGPAAVSEAPLHELDVKWLLDQTRVLLEQEHRRGETVDTCSAASCTRWRELKARLRGADPGVRPDAPEGRTTTKD